MQYQEEICSFCLSLPTPSHTYHCIMATILNAVLVDEFIIGTFGPEMIIEKCKKKMQGVITVFVSLKKGKAHNIISSWKQDPH